ncbi:MULTISPECIES: 4-hydroxy-tetrahydrodipicolinate synthase [Paenibacillus]|uniref:4-hydroxy-tetrahydrodipicolinate synthase n=2 Tax=Paenibacillus TaxID=44249 RepID=A0AAP5H176_PAEAM|nr:MULTISPECIES: 4-hydroxy-tetrahydrodipicolinate synthase [Paenibacillus]KQY83172.1 4-hydroxy-tetrahydrodipicolinate synthase [Paenibacillus sp. Root52]MCG7376871.1 4-hydroxy-tetrahydrodipicolinate synthase [Paenibacillus sp. ACRSA]MDQ0169989.1 4-hydroxy-tetrahydrodipicolinate synthase [Paenibacillus tundrae]MDR6722264.1 4-hydroxy-tetrahydrodipicolinate synthase [Paenibacillus amylolyticus]
MDFGRLITAMVTPFNDQGEIHWEETARLIDYLIVEQKSETLVVSGTTGESPTLSDSEKVQLFEFTVKHAAGRCKIIAGTGSNNTAHSIHLTQEAERVGADGVLLVVPYYNKPSQEGMFKHFEAIAASTKLPVMLYNVPGRTVASLTAATTLRLAQIPNIIATKECASLEHVTLIAADAPEHFRVYTGDDASGLPALAVGAHGIVSVASHVIGAEMKTMIDSFVGGDPLQAAKIHQKLFPIFKGLFECPQPLPNPVAVKYALTMRGLNVGSVRLPLIAPTEEEQVYIRGLFN